MALPRAAPSQRQVSVNELGFTAGLARPKFDCNSRIEQHLEERTAGFGVYQYPRNIPTPPDQLGIALSFPNDVFARADVAGFVLFDLRTLLSASVRYVEPADFFRAEFYRLFGLPPSEALMLSLDADIGYVCAFDIALV